MFMVEMGENRSPHPASTVGAAPTVSSALRTIAQGIAQLADALDADPAPPAFPGAGVVLNTLLAANSGAIGTLVEGVR